MIYAFLIYFLLFFYLAYKNFKLSLGLIIILLPTYLLRVEYWLLTSTILELSLGAVFLIWVLKYLKKDWKELVLFYKGNKIFVWLCVVFFISSVMGIFVSDEWYKSFGHWRAFFFEPMLFFIILIGRRKELNNFSPEADQPLSENFLIKCLAWSSGLVSSVAVLQIFSKYFYPSKFLLSGLAGRATSFFTSPNAIGLYIVPTTILLIGFLYKEFKQKKQINYFYLVIIILNCLALLLSFSQGAWIALGVGILALLYFWGYKKIVLIGIIFSILLTIFITPINQAVRFADKAGENRLVIWGYTVDYLLESPQNFVLGTGIRQWFRKIQKPYYDTKQLERLTFPHSIFLNFWTEIGLLGEFSFLGILAYLIYLLFGKIKEDKITAGIFMSMILAFVVHGLVDVPYFKNDLAILTWVWIFMSLQFLDDKLSS